MKKFIDDIRNMRLAIIILIIYFVIMHIIFGTVCPFRALFKIRCPGCGLTHATMYLFMGKIDKALKYNPIVIFWVPAIILFFIDRYFYKIKIKVFPYIFIIVSIITLVWYIYSIGTMGFSYLVVNS